MYSLLTDGTRPGLDKLWGFFAPFQFVMNRRGYIGQPRQVSSNYIRCHVSGLMAHSQNMRKSNKAFRDQTQVFDHFLQRRDERLGDFQLLVLTYNDLFMRNIIVYTNGKVWIGSFKDYILRRSP